MELVFFSWPQCEFGLDLDFLIFGYFGFFPPGSCGPREHPLAQGRPQIPGTCHRGTLSNFPRSFFSNYNWNHENLYCSKHLELQERQKTDVCIVLLVIYFGSASIRIRLPFPRSASRIKLTKIKYLFHSYQLKISICATLVFFRINSLLRKFFLE